MQPEGWRDEVERMMKLDDKQLVLETAKVISATEGIRAEISRRQTDAANRASRWLIALTGVGAFLTLALVALTIVLVLLTSRLSPAG